jgi:hypothetical protein
VFFPPQGIEGSYNLKPHEIKELEDGGLSVVSVINQDHPIFLANVWRTRISLF